VAFPAKRTAGPSNLPVLRALGGEHTAELNITPMIDAALALPIIFMVVTPVSPNTRPRCRWRATPSPRR
jgi:hypothetical protein